MKILAASLLTVALMGLMMPSALGETFINQEKSYPFSIEYPSNWEIVSVAPVSGDGVMIDSDKTGRNGMWIGFWKNVVDSSPLDNELLEFQKNNIQIFCNDSTQEQHFGQCSDLEFKINKVQQVDGFRAVTSIMKYDWFMEQPDPMFEDSSAGKFPTIDTLTWVLSGNDIWIIATTNDAENFDKKQIHDIIHSFKLKNIETPIPEPQPKSWFDNILDFFKLLFG